MYGRLLTAEDQKGAKKDVPLLLPLRFSLAVLLAHELCHAVRYPSKGDIAMDPFLGKDVAVSERGFEWEIAVFSGRFQVLYGHYDGASNHEDTIKIHNWDHRSSGLSELIGVPVFWNWPDRMTKVSYCKHKLGLWRRND